MGDLFGKDVNSYDDSDESSSSDDSFITIHSVRVEFGDRDAPVLEIQRRNLLVVLAPLRPDLQHTTTVTVSVFNTNQRGLSRKAHRTLQFTYLVPNGNEVVQAEPEQGSERFAASI